jgi:hypothetical protein
MLAFWLDKAFSVIHARLSFSRTLAIGTLIRILTLEYASRDVPSGVVLENQADGDDWGETKEGYTFKMKGISDDGTRYVREGAKGFQQEEEDDGDVEYA